MNKVAMLGVFNLDGAPFIGAATNLFSINAYKSVRTYNCKWNMLLYFPEEFTIISVESWIDSYIIFSQIAENLALVFSLSKLIFMNGLNF